MNRTLAATAAAFVAVLLAGCSASSTPASDNKPVSARPSQSAGDPVGYLYDVDHHRRPRAEVETLVQTLRSRCVDDVLGLEFAATNTATGLVDARHAQQDAYSVLEQLAVDMPRGSGKFRCAPGLPGVAEQIKAKRAATASPTATPKAATHRPAPAQTTHQAAPHTTAPAVDDHGGATAKCNDGTLSYSAHHQGTCSHHHGVAIWYK